MFGFSQALRGLTDESSFANLVLVVAIVAYLAQLLLDPSNIRMEGFFGLLGPGPCPSFLLGESGSAPVAALGRWWTILSAGLLHGGLIHIGFNMMWVRQLGPNVARTFGVGRSAILFVVSSAVGFAMTSGISWVGLTTSLGSFLPNALDGARYTLGASAAIFGWIGALIYFGKRSGQTEMARQLLMSFALPLSCAASCTGSR